MDPNFKRTTRSKSAALAASRAVDREQSSSAPPARAVRPARPVRAVRAVRPPPPHPPPQPSPPAAASGAMVDTATIAPMFQDSSIDHSLSATRGSVFSEVEDAALIKYKEIDDMSWAAISTKFQNRSKGTLQVRYCRSLQYDEPPRRAALKALYGGAENYSHCMPGKVRDAPSRGLVRKRSAPAEEEEEGASKRQKTESEGPSQVPQLSGEVVPPRSRAGSVPAVQGSPVRAVTFAGQVTTISPTGIKRTLDHVISDGGDNVEEQMVTRARKRARAAVAAGPSTSSSAGAEETGAALEVLPTSRRPPAPKRASASALQPKPSKKTKGKKPKNEIPVVLAPVSEYRQGVPVTVPGQRKPVMTTAVRRPETAVRYRPERPNLQFGTESEARASEREFLARQRTSGERSGPSSGWTELSGGASRDEYPEIAPVFYCPPEGKVVERHLRSGSLRIRSRK